MYNLTMAPLLPPEACNSSSLTNVIADSLSVRARLPERVLKHGRFPASESKLHLFESSNPRSSRLSRAQLAVSMSPAFRGTRETTTDSRKKNGLAQGTQFGC